MNLEQAFNTYYKELVFFGNKLIENKQAVEDIVVDVFVSLKNPEIDGIRFYLYRSVKNRCINYLIQLKSRRVREIRANDWIEATAIINVDYLKKMHDALLNLKGAEKEVIDLLMQGKNTVEVSEILNKSMPTIRSIKRHAIIKLRKAIL